MADVDHEEEIATTSNKLLFYAGVLGLIAMAFALIPGFLPLRSWVGGASAPPANAVLNVVLHVKTFLMAACYIVLIRSRAKGAKWILILLGVSVFDTLFRFVGYQRFPIVYHFSIIFNVVAGFAVFMNLAIRNKGGLRIAFGAQGFAYFVSGLVTVWWGVFFNPQGGLPPSNMMMLTRLIGPVRLFLILFGWMYLLYVARGSRATGEESAAVVPWPWRVLVAFFPELLVLFFCRCVNDLGLFAFALVAFAFGAGGPLGCVGMILGGLAYLVFAILVMRCKRWVRFYQLIGCGFALLIVNAIGLVVLSKRHF